LGVSNITGGGSSGVDMIDDGSMTGVGVAIIAIVEVETLGVVIC
jgi:hypothetical protein